MDLLESAWLLIPLAIYLVVIRWITLRADRALSKSYRRLPYKLCWPVTSSRRYALWWLPVLGGIIAIACILIDIHFALTGSHVRDLPGRLFPIVWLTALFLIAQLALLAHIRRWVRREQARRADQRRARQERLRTGAGPATPPAT